MSRIRWLAIPLFVVMLTFSFVGSASAIALIPSSFYGQTHISDNPPLALPSGSYTGSAGADPAGLAVDSAYAAAPTDAGNRMVTADFTRTNTRHFNTLPIAPAGNLTINKIRPKLSVTNSPVVYNGSPQAANVVGSVAGTVSNVQYNGSAIVPTDAATYAVTADFTPTDTTLYSTLTDAPAGKFVIDKANATLSVANSPVVYNGSPQAANVIGSVAGSISNVLYNSSATVPTNAATYVVTADFAPDDGTNYSSVINSAAGNFIIDRANATIDVTPYAVTYDGFAHTATGTAIGVLSESLNGLFLGNTTHTDAGTYSGDSWTFSDVTGNYNNVDPTTITNSIGKATPTIDITGGSFAYDGSPHPALCSVSGVGSEVPSGVCDITYNGSSTPPTAIGQYSVAATFTSSNANYTNASYADGPSQYSVIITTTNQPPTGLHLSNQSIHEAQPSGTVVGTFTTDNADTTDTFIYSLVTVGCPGTDNSFFRVSGDTLVSRAVFDYEKRSSYEICAQTDDGHGHTLSQAFTITILNLPGGSMRFRSVAADDGWILESTAGSHRGGAVNASGSTFVLGDDAKNRQYRSILSFNTAGLPNNAILTSVKLQIKREGISGSDPFGSLGSIAVDIQKPFFGSARGLQAVDFKAASNPAGAVGSMLKPIGAANGSWYTVNLDPSAFKTVNVDGITQLRLRFANSSNQNKLANVLKFYSGNSARAFFRPMLTVQYALPWATISFNSVASDDGWVLESATGSGRGGTVNATGDTFQLGDDAKNRQYRSILSFNTAGIPDNARLMSVILQIERQGKSGDNPFNSMGNLLVDTRKPFFSTRRGLQAADFQAKADHSALLSIPNMSIGNGWYFVSLPASDFDVVNLTGTTQFRLRFEKSSNHNRLSDLLRFYSGNAINASSRPILTIVYFLP